VIPPSPHVLLPRSKVLTFLVRLDAHHRLGIALLVALVVVVWPASGLPGIYRLVVGWIGFTATSLILAWSVIIAGDPEVVRRTARLQDGGRTLIFIIVLLAACGSFAAVGILLSFGRVLGGVEFAVILACSLAAVILSWLEVHTSFILRYAHMYYARDDLHDAHHGGLLFPGGKPPDFMDFAYFSLVLGMTSQVSDVQITSRRLRRLAMLHGVVSFAFNTIILALAINMIATIAFR
jgi:uncharacterized membrane protein